jgi:hypothetical protein
MKYTVTIKDYDDEVKRSYKTFDKAYSVIAKDFKEWIKDLADDMCDYSIIEKEMTRMNEEIINNKSYAYKKRGYNKYIATITEE